MDEPIRVKGICTICWENSTKDSKYSDVCDSCLPLTKNYKESLLLANKAISDLPEVPEMKHINELCKRSDEAIEKLKRLVD